MGRINGKPDSTFPIGAGCTKTFGHAGDLVVFANDKPDGYSNNRGSVKLTARQGGVAPTQGADIGGWIGAWHRIPRRFQPHGGHPDHRRFRLRCVVDPCLHAAGAGPGARDRRGRFPPVSVRRFADHVCAGTSLPCASGLGLVADDRHLELRRRPKQMAAQMASRLDASRSRRRAFCRSRDGARHEPRQQDLVRRGADRARRDVLRLRGLAPGNAQAPVEQSRGWMASLAPALLRGRQPDRSGGGDGPRDAVAGENSAFWSARLRSCSSASAS